jgi:hypothetical protein
VRPPTTRGIQLSPHTLKKSHPGPVPSGTSVHASGYPPLGIDETGMTLGTLRWNPMSLQGTMEEGTMWIALFSIASASAVCLSVAAVVLQANQGDVLRG